MKNAKSCVIYCVTSIIAIMCALQTNAQERALSFDEALLTMQSQNKTLEAATINEAYYAQKRKAAKGLFMPRISLAGNWTHMSDDIHADFTETKHKAAEGMAAIAGRLPPQTAQLLASIAPAIGSMLPDKYIMQEQNVAFLSANAIWPIFTGGKILAANKMAKLHEHEAKEQTQYANQKLITELVERYYGLRLAAQVVKVRQTVFEAMEKHLAEAKKLEASGMIALAERLHAEVSKSNAHRELQIAKSKFRTVSSALQNTLGDSLASTPKSPLFMCKDVEQLEYFINAATAKNIQLRMVDTKAEMAHMATIVARSAYMPNLAATAHWRIADNGINEHMLPNWMVGVSMQWTLFDGMARSHRYVAAKRLEKRVAVIKDKASEDIRTLVTKQYNELQSHIEQLEAIEATHYFAGEYVRVREKAFKEGFATSMELVDAELMLSKVQTGRLKILFDYDLALAKLLQVSGLSDQFANYAAKPNVEPESFETNE